MNSILYALIFPHKCCPYRLLDLSPKDDARSEERATCVGDVFSLCTKVSSNGTQCTNLNDTSKIPLERSRSTEKASLRHHKPRIAPPCQPKMPSPAPLPAAPDLLFSKNKVSKYFAMSRTIQNILSTSPVLPSLLHPTEARQATLFIRAQLNLHSQLTSSLPDHF